MKIKKKSHTLSSNQYETHVEFTYLPLFRQIEFYSMYVRKLYACICFVYNVYALSIRKMKTNFNYSVNTSVYALL